MISCTEFITDGIRNVIPSNVTIKGDTCSANAEDHVELAVPAARNIVGAENVEANVQPMMISEDFGAFLQVVPGNVAFIGNGDTGETGGVPLHNATYDFNDDILLTGARYFAEIARLALPLA